MSKMITKEVAKVRIEELREEIKKHDRLYEQNRPIITDTEYDNLYIELVGLENQFSEFYSADSPTQKIYTVVVDGLKKVRHSQPMLSQEKCTKLEEVEKFFQRGHGKVLAQQKLDGLTIVLTYENGKLETAVSRGTGEIGEDVTHTVRTFKNVPKFIQFKNHLELRMEAIIPYAEFEKFNVDGKYSNTRNLASGSVRQLDASLAAERGLKGIVFDLVNAEGKAFEDDIEQLTFLKEQGFEVVETEVFDLDTEAGKKACLDYIENYATTIRPTLPHAIDGLVLKFNDFNVRLELGSTAKHPRWGIAFKFASQDATSTLRKIILQVGKTGQITPVAEFDEVDIDGVHITRATLHNFGNIARKDIRIGDKILISRANDVIPQVIKSFPEERTEALPVYEAPAECHVCHHPTEFIGENLYCTNEECTPQLVGKLEHFVSRGAMNIDGLGEKTVDLLFENGLIKEIPDLFELKNHQDEILKLERFGVKKYEKMVAGIEVSKAQPFHRVLYGLSIPLIGETASKEIAKVFKSMDDLVKNIEENPEITRNRLLNIDDFGDTMVNSIFTYFAKFNHIELIQRLHYLDLTMESEFMKNSNSNGASQQSLNGKVFVITGALSKSRDEFKEDIEALGGKVTGSVSKKTTYLLMGKDAEGTSKHQKALDLGITILDEEGFNQLIG